jgi:tetratricopeptide (TPR) repeat protein
VTGHQLTGRVAIVGGRYRLGETLGEGGMGVVHAVTDRVDGSELALKWLSAETARNPVAVELFEREFHTLKNLAHPHIVSVLEYGIDGTPFYTMERLRGETADKRAPMPWKDACSVLRDVASALALVHSRRLLHRDVTTRNVHCGRDGTVKLIDFGGLTPMGVARHVVGTPSFMAPETLNQVSLDQRTDLYSLGATAYHLLTGRHAYPARTMFALRSAWCTRPRPPSGFAQVPPELDKLVMAMLDLNPGARPSNASIVMAQLTAVAGLPPQPSEESARSFLATPRLVGRDKEVSDFRARVTRAMQHQGSCVLVEAQAGMGRSRILDAFALEAQILGAVVLRADGRDGAGEPEVLAALERGLRHGAQDDGTDSLEPQAAANDLSVLKQLRRIMRSRGAVVVIDDLHQYAPAALPLIARLLRLTEEQKLVLVCSYALPLPDSVLGGVELLRTRGDRVELGALSSDQTRELLDACFDGAPNLRSAADFCHAVSAGRPGTNMALAQHLVDEGIAVYQQGAWALPESLAGRALPDTAEQLIAERVRRLNDDQRLLGQLFSLIPAAVELSTAECVDIMQPYLTRARFHAALDGLVAEQLVTAARSSTRVDHPNVRDAFCATLSEALASSLHRKLAAHLVPRDDGPSLSAAAYHMQQAGEFEAAVRLVNIYAKRMTEPMSEEELARQTLPFGQWGETFERALEFAEQQHWPRRELYHIYTAIMSTAALSEPRWLSRGRPLFDYLRQDTGLCYYSDAELDALERGAPVNKLRLVWRLLKATVRHLLARPTERGLLPHKALELLGVYTTSELGAANMTQTFHTAGPALVRALVPFRVLSPALDLLHQLMVGSVDAGRGLAAGWARLQGVMARLRKRVGGMPDVYRSAAYTIVRYLDALECRAPLGDPECLEVAKELQETGGFDTHAWQLRMLYHLYVGDSVNAERCRQELETHALSSSRDNLSVVAGSKDVAQAQALSGDALALRRTLESLEKTAARFPGWQGQMLVYRGEYARLVGDLPAALAALEQALAFASVGTNYSWSQAVVPYIDVLLRLGRVADAVAFAERAVADAEHHRVAPVHLRQIRVAAALAWATAGQHERASTTLDTLLEEAAALGIRGMTMAVLHEGRARVALMAGDTEAFERASRGAARVFANSDNPALVARYGRLLDEARQANLVQSADAGDKEALISRTLDGLRERIEHTTSAVRWRHALELLIDQCDAAGGHLFVVRNEQVQCVASVGEVVSMLEMEGFADAVRRRENDADEGETVANLGLDDDVTRCTRWTSTSGAIYDPVLLPSFDGSSDARAVGIAILRPKNGLLRNPDPRFMQGLVRTLAETGDLQSSAP